MKSVNQNGEINNDFMNKLVAFITETAYEQLPQQLVDVVKKGHYRYNRRFTRRMA